MTIDIECCDLYPICGHKYARIKNLDDYLEGLNNFDITQ